MVIFDAIAVTFVAFARALQESKQVLAVQHLRAGPAGAADRAMGGSRARVQDRDQPRPAARARALRAWPELHGDEALRRVRHRIPEMPRRLSRQRVRDGWPMMWTRERRLDDQIRSLRDEKHALESGRVRTQNVQASVNRLDTEIAGARDSASARSQRRASDTGLHLNRPRQRPLPHRRLPGGRTGVAQRRRRRSLDRRSSQQPRRRLHADRPFRRSRARGQAGGEERLQGARELQG